MWGYERAANTWHMPSLGPPGRRPAEIGQAPTDKELEALQKSAEKRWQLLVPRGVVGIGLLLTWGVLIILAVLAGWHAEVKIMLKLHVWLFSD